MKKLEIEADKKIDIQLKKIVIYLTAVFAIFLFFPYFLINSSKYFRVGEPENFKNYIMAYMVINVIFILGFIYLKDKQSQKKLLK